MCDRKTLLGLTRESCFQIKVRVKLSMRLAKMAVRQTSYLNAEHWWVLAEAIGGDASELHHEAMCNIIRFVEHSNLYDARDSALAKDMIVQMEALAANELQSTKDLIDLARDAVETLRIRDQVRIQAIRVTDARVWSIARKIRDVDAIIEDAMLIFGATAALEYIVEDISVLFAGGE